MLNFEQKAAIASLVLLAVSIIVIVYMYTIQSMFAFAIIISKLIKYQCS